jgi:8-oxo-dGTP diphosphatase
MIIGITGTLASGKGTISEILEKKGFKHLSVRNFLIQELQKRNLEINRDNMVHLANELRTNNSPSFIVEQLYNQAKQTSKDTIIESIRNPGEIEALRKKPSFYLIAIDAEPKIRYQRLTEKSSETDYVSFEEFLDHENREMQSSNPNNQDISKCIEQADFVIENNTTVEELEEKVGEIIDKIKSRELNNSNTKKYQKIAVGGLLFHNGKILIVKRSQLENFLPGFYELPGGKVNFGESTKEAIEREFKEEVNLNVTSLKPCNSYSYISDNGNRHTIDILHIVQLIDNPSNIKLSKEHDEFKWINPIDIDSINMTEEMKGNIRLGMEELNNYQIPKSNYINKDDPFEHWDKPSWDDYFMGIALLASTRSIDPSAKHGCVIVDKNKKILSIGYNGPPKGSDDEKIPLTRPHKYLFMEHAEKNAILNRQLPIEGSTMYITGPSCLQCTRSIIQSGVKKVIYGPFKSRGINSKDDEAIKILTENRHDFTIEEFKGDILKCLRRAIEYYETKIKINQDKEDNKNIY